MRFSEHFGLTLSQPELNFVDVELATDTRLFLDPYSIGIRGEEWSRRCATSITVFFDCLLDAVRQGDDERARVLLGSLHEPNETRLGLSRNRPQGSAIGDKLALEILESLKNSEAVRTGLLRDLAEGELFVDGVGHDRISDLVTNIIRRELIEYTQEQCHLHGIALRGTAASGPMWDAAQMTWFSDMVQLPIVDGHKVLLVPKVAVRWRPLLTPGDYYNNYVLNYIQADELRSGRMGLIRHLKKGGRRVYKTDLKRTYPLTKGFLRAFTQHHPAVLEAYKEAKAEVGKTPDDLSKGEFDEGEFARQLIMALEGIPRGSDGATAYHNLMIGLIEFLLFPNLLFPNKEHEIHEGRKRIDIVYTNAATYGIFESFSRTTRKTSTRIMVECKNYSSDPANPELDQISGRFADHRGWLGLLTFRVTGDMDMFVARCRDTARDGRGYVIPLQDADIIEMLRCVERGRRQEVDGILNRRFVELTR